ncbi:MAG: SGNH/GDSL hydrolase family protein [Terracoccus sp.]
MLVALMFSAQACVAPGLAVEASRPGASLVVLALGDSVPAGTACGCSPFPAVFGSLLHRHTGAAVTVDNEAVSGLDTTGLLAQLRQRRAQRAVRRADVVLLTIGANDFADNHDRVVAGDCALDTASACISDELAAMRTQLTTVLAEIRAMRAGRPTPVLVTGYWNVFEDGEVARHADGVSGLQASLALTRRVNETISAVASSAGAHYVDLFDMFQGRGDDIDSLLAEDGDHPDAAGHRLIAAALLAAALPPVS